jgi:predicted metal-dependent phosphoesterase TrpH
MDRPIERADLHSHSTASDGALSPAALVLRARRQGIAVLALTDHDTMDGVPEAVAAGARVGLRVVPGVELSARVPIGSMHLLGYFATEAPPEMVARLAEFRRRRVARAREMVDRLADLGAPVTWDDVLRRAGGAVGRPHLAEALVAAGHVADRAEAFARYLADDGPAYIPSSVLDPEEAIRLVVRSGGAPVMAHPFSLRLDQAALRDALGAFRDMGLRGIEAHRPDHDAAASAFLASLADELGLTPTGGSDFHRPDGPVELGDTGHTPLAATVVDVLFGGPVQ